MKMKILNKHIILFFLLPLIIFGGSIKDSAEEKIKSVTKCDEVIFEKFQIDKKLRAKIERKTGQRFFGDFVYKWKVYKSDTLSNVVFLDNVLGKTLPISFMVVFDLSGNVVMSDVVKYRESHGGQVQEDNWHTQFVGRNDSSGFVVGKDIDGISGATISSNSVSKGIKKLCLLFAEINKSK